MVREDKAAKMKEIDDSLALFRRLANLTIDEGGGHGEEGEEGLPRQMVKIREDQVCNNAGGYVFKVDDLTRVRRFLILGTDGGTYYVGERELAVDNLGALIECIRAGKGGMVLREIVDISLAGRAPKQDPLLLALALCARYSVKDRKHLVEKRRKVGDGEEEEKATSTDEEEIKFEKYIMELQKTALRAVDKVCRIPTHLFTFVKYCELISKSTGDEHTGWGRAMRKCVAEWYLQKPPMVLAMHLTKYPSRAGWSHRDLLRLAHPMARDNNRSPRRLPFEHMAENEEKEENEKTLVYDQMFHFACTGDFDAAKANLPAATTAEGEDAPVMKKSRCDYTLTKEMVEYAAKSDALEFIRRVKEAAQLKMDETGETRCVDLIREYRLVREHIPTELLNSPKVWIAMLEHMPMTALLRNLSKLGTLGLLDEEKNKQYVDLAISKLLDQEAIHRARIHPISVLLGGSVYKQGRGIRGKLTWGPNGRVVKALDDMFLLAFKNVQPTGKRYCLALDVSGSMSSPISGGVLSCCEASAAMATVFLRTENVECVAFQNTLTPLPFTKTTTLGEILKKVDNLNFGSTDCSQPMLWAMEARKPFDCFIVFTDSETWAGKVQPFEALRQYRLGMGIADAKLAVMGMASTGFTIADPTDPGMLDIVGLDSAVPELLRAFVLNEI